MSFRIVEHCADTEGLLNRYSDMQFSAFQAKAPCKSLASTAS